MGIMDRKSLVDEAYEKIREKICNFELMPGRTLSDFTLSKELGMSRTPIRAALQRIENEGLIRDGGAGQGYVVCEITEDEIIDLFDARCGLEMTALRLIERKGLTEEGLEQLRLINGLLQSAYDRKEIRHHFVLDQKFHDKLVCLSQNDKLARFHDTVRLQLSRMRVLSYLEPTYQKKACDEHEQLLQYLIDGNWKGAEDVLFEHIESTKENYVNLLKNRLDDDIFNMIRYFMNSEIRI